MYIYIIDGGIMDNIKDIFKKLKEAKCTQKNIAIQLGLQETFVSGVKIKKYQLPIKYFKKFYKIVQRNGLKISHEELFDICYEKK